MAKKKRTYESTTVNIAPLTVDEALEALLKTPPPPKDEAAPKKKGAKK